MARQSSPARAALLGDVVGSRLASNRKALHDRLSAALQEISAEVEALDDLRVTAGDEFRATFATVGEALYAALLLRLRLDPDIDVRIGVGWGGVIVLDAAHSTQDGPAWWAARAAIEWVKEHQSVVGFEQVRTAYRPAEEAEKSPSDAPAESARTTVGPSPEAVNAALLSQDQLIGSMDQRSRFIMKGLLHGHTQTRLAKELGLTRQAVNQRRKHDGLAIAVESARSLRSVE